MRVVSYDPDAYFNENCEVFFIDELEDEGGEIYSSAPVSERPQDKSSRIELYVQEWEKRHLPLDDYQDWMTIGMALASVGEECRDYFRRISVFSSKYNSEDTDRKFNEFLQNTRSIRIGSFFYKCHNMALFQMRYRIMRMWGFLWRFCQRQCRESYMTRMIVRIFL